MLTVRETGTARLPFPPVPSTYTQLECSNKQELLISSANIAIKQQVSQLPTECCFNVYGMYNLQTTHIYHMFVYSIDEWNHTKH